MRAVLIILSILLSTSVFANGLQILQLEDLDLTYLSPDGEGKLRKFKFGVDVGGKNNDPGRGSEFLHDIDIKAVNQDLFLESDFSYVVWRNAPDFLINSSKIVTRDLFLFFTMDKTSLDAAQLNYHLGGNQFDLFGLKTLCQSKSRSGSIPDRLLENCMFNSKVSVDKLDFIFSQKEKNFIETTVHEAYEQKIDFPIKSVRELNLEVKKGAFNISCIVDYLFDVKTLVQGELMPNIEQESLTIKVDKVKLGKLSVTKLALWAIKKANITNVTVNGNLVEIKL